MRLTGMVKTTRNGAGERVSEMMNAACRQCGKIVPKVNEYVPPACGGSACQEAEYLALRDRLDLALRREEIVMAMIANANGGEVHVASEEDKRATRSLERKGIVSVRRTAVRFGGQAEWWVK